MSEDSPTPIEDETSLYVAGLLTPEQSDDLMDRAKKDSELAAEISLLRRMLGGVISKRESELYSDAS